MVKSLIICISVHHQNTLKVAQVIAKVLKAKIISPQESKKLNLKEYKLVGFGSGIYFGQFHKTLLQFIEGLSEKSYPQAFVFSTSGSGLKVYNQTLIKKLKQKGFEVIDDFTCRGFDTWGPYKLIGGLAKNKPDKKDLQAAKIFAQQLLKHLKKINKFS